MHAKSTIAGRHARHHGFWGALGLAFLPLTAHAAPTAAGSPVSQASDMHPTAAAGHPQMITPFAAAPSVTAVVHDLQWAEGPMWNAATAELIFTDLAADRIYRLSGTEAVVVTQDTNTFANGIAAGIGGSWVVCEHKTQRVRRRSGNTWTTLASSWQGRPFNSPNDSVTRSDGTIYFTDPTYGSLPQFGGATPQQSFQGVFRISPDGEVHLVDDALQQPNGIALNRTGTKLYVADTQTGAIMRYAVASDGSTAAGEQIATVSQADGMTVDRVGYIYVAGEMGVRVLRSGGATFGTISVPEQPSNVEFGGADGKRLFITARTSIYRVDLRIAG